MNRAPLPMAALAAALFSFAGTASLRAGAQPFAFEHAVIDAAPPANPWIKAAADLDRDGRMDVIIGGSKGPLVWYAGPDWKKSVIAASGYDSVDAEAGDVDGDGDPDLVVGGILWYENPLPAAGPGSGPWRARRIGTHRTHDVELADLDGDGRLDVAVRGQTGFGHREGHRVLLWKQLSPDRWQSREIPCPEGEGLKLADIDRDGDADVVIAGRWFENPGSILTGAWAERVYTDAWTHGDAKVETADLDGDGRLDVALAPAEPRGGSYRIAWYSAPADPRAGGWKEGVVEPAVESVVHALAAGDLDGDGMADLVTARMHQGAAPQEVCAYRSREAGRAWTKQVLSPRGSHNILLADLDGNGAPDVLGANHGGPRQPVEWWKNGAARKAVAGLSLAEGPDESAGGVVCYRIDTPSAVYYLEKSGAGLSSLLDADGADWLGFHPEPGSGAGGEYRGFPNAVHRQMGSYFHPRNAATGASRTQVLLAGRDRIAIEAVSGNDAWACRYDFYPTHCTWTMTRAPAGFRYWALYEGVPGGGIDDGDWWMTSAVRRRMPLTAPHEGDIPGPEWIAFGDGRRERSLCLLHHEDDDAPDRFYLMQGKMTVFGFGRSGLEKLLERVPRSVTIGFVESAEHAAVARWAAARQ